MAQHVSIVIPIIGLIFYLLTVFNFLACFFIDPGYLPRASACEAFKTELEHNIATDLAGNYYPPPRTKIIQIKGRDYEMRYCVN